MRRTKLIITLAIIGTLVIGSISAYASASFTDLKNTNWAYKYVDSLVSKKGIVGYPDNTFRPNNTITNAEFIKTLVAVTLGEQEKTDKHWASGYMDKALKEGIMKDGEIEKSAWDKPMSRQAMAVAIARTSENIIKEDLSPTQPDKIKSQIKDYNSICDYCKDYVVAVYEKGIISGYPNGTFGGEKTATRAEASSMVVRLLDKEQRQDPFKTTGSINEIITNPVEADLVSDKNPNAPGNIKTYVKLTKEEAAKYEFEKEGWNKGSFSFTAKDIGMAYYIKDGKAKSFQVTGDSYLASDANIKYDYLGFLGNESNAEGFQTILYIIEDPFK